MNLHKDSNTLRNYFTFLLVFMVLGLPSLQARSQGIKWQVAPYLWAFDTSLDMVVNNEPALGGDLTFKDAIDKLDGSFMGHVEGAGEVFGVFGDIILVNLTDSKIKTIGPGGPILGDLIMDTNLKLKLYEVGGFYRIGDPTSVSATFDLMLGARIVDVDQKMNFTLLAPGVGNILKSINITETDIFFGGRVMGKLSERWHYNARVDMGGGGTEGTLNLMAAIGYTFGQTGLFSMDFGYKYLAIDLATNDGETYLESKIVMSGPLIGFVFNF